MSIAEAWIALTPHKHAHVKCLACGATETMSDGRCSWCRTARA